ncbi:hypothetical protein BCR33DRAFT_717071, partial [Rhizoclosmatium globosum]
MAYIKNSAASAKTFTLRSNAPSHYNNAEPSVRELASRRDIIEYLSLRPSNESNIPQDITIITQPRYPTVVTTIPGFLPGDVLLNIPAGYRFSGPSIVSSTQTADSPSMTTLSPMGSVPEVLMEELNSNFGTPTLSQDDETQTASSCNSNLFASNLEADPFAFLLSGPLEQPTNSLTADISQWLDIMFEPSAQVQLPGCSSPTTDLSSGNTKQRKRVHLSQMQRDHLTSVFKENKMPDPKMLKELAQKLERKRNMSLLVPERRADEGERASLI